VILSEKVFKEIITWRYKSDFHFIPKGKNVTKMDNSARGVNVQTSDLDKIPILFPLECN